MAFWLAKKRDGQHSDYIQRFDPRFWTVDFARPNMGSVVATAADALRVEVAFHNKDALAGLIWASEDTLDHPLLAYDTNRDYSHTELRFRWRSDSVIALDAVHGPTLTIEGEDASGTPRAWYVRLWNYASGSPTDADIAINFSSLAGGWDIVSAPDPVEPKRIDRMFISIVPPGYDPTDSGLLSDPVDGWVELTGMNCHGDHAMLAIGDVLLPPHDIGMATAYDDSYNQTPARLLRNIRGLGYRGEIIHYVGMSHYPRLVPQSDGSLTVQGSNGELCVPAASWHRAYFEACAAQGFEPIASISAELLDDYCPDDWKQRAHDGSPALTGWVPPSTLLAFRQSGARLFMRRIFRAFANLMVETGVSVKMQFGEPWWWVTTDYAPCIYDDAARSEFSGVAPDITDLRNPLTQAQEDVLIEAGKRMKWALDNCRNDVLGIEPTAEFYLLLFTPTLLDPQVPHLQTLNVPTQFASPAYERLQLEDYDWLTAGAEALRKAGYTTMDTTLAYPLDAQDYMAGFVLDPADAETSWPLIDAGLDEAAERGVPRRFVWALPQVCRDGYTRLAEPAKDDDMQAYDDVLYPLPLGRDAGVSTEFSTAVAVTASGHEHRRSQWQDARMSFDVGPGIRSETELGILIEFFRARRGAARGFRVSDPFDFSSNAMTGTPTMLDQIIGSGDGLTATYQLRKSYGPVEDPQLRAITRPQVATILVSIDGVITSDWNYGDSGKIVFTDAPPAGSIIRAGFLFDVPVRFAEDRLDVSGVSFAAGEAPSVPLIEVREAV